MSNQLIALMRHGAICLALGLTFSAAAFAQTPVARQTAQAELSPAESESKPIRDGKAEKDKEDAPSLLEEMRRMRQLIERLEARISQLEAEKSAPVLAGKDASILTQTTTPSQAQTATLSADDRDTLDFWRDTTVNVVIDGYYGYNFNRPLGGINLLRAYDVSSNSFGLNQGGVIFEQAPKVEEGRRFGARLDLMFGQATETLQGSAVNELRPRAFRHVW